MANFTSIKNEIFKSLGYSFLIITLIAMVSIYTFINYAIHKYFDDRLLHESEDIISRLYIEKSKIKFKNPHLGIHLQTSAGDSSVFYSIEDSSRNLLFGFKGIPDPKEMSYQKLLYDADFLNQQLRVFRAYHTILRNKHSYTVIITIAETLEDRKAILYKIYLIFTIITLLIVLGAILSTFLAVNRGLMPLKYIQNSIQKRDANDLSAIDEAGVPLEVISMVQSINTLFRKLKKSFLHIRQFNADVSHQLKTPLSELKLYIEIDASIDNKQKKHYLSNIDSITHTIEQLLLYAHTSPKVFDHIHFRPFNLTKLCKDIAMRKAPILYRDGFEIAFHVEGDIWINGDAIIIETLLNNLIDNAQKYAHSDQSAKHTITLRIEEKDNTTIMSISDNGPGMPEAHLDKVCNRFIRIDTEKQGSGLGLSIVKQIVELHHGSIELTNIKPHGLNVSISLPKYDKKAMDSQ